MSTNWPSCLLRSHSFASASAARRAASGQCSLRAAAAQLRPPFEQRDLLDQERQRLGGAAHEVPPARLLVRRGLGPRRARRGRGRAGSGAEKPSSYQVLPSEMP